MRGVIDADLFERFAKVTEAFPPTDRDPDSAQEVFKKSYQELYDIDTGVGGVATFARVKAWRAYALALSVYEGWRLPNVPERNWNDDQRKQTALDWADEAIGMDGTDHDLYWARADVHLIRGDYAAAVTDFERALRLSADERHPSLFAEAAAAYMHLGNHDKAEEYFKKARREPDWHRWMNGIFLFIKAGRARVAGVNEETLLDLALDELRGTRANPDEDYYQNEIQLILAAASWKKSQIIADKAALEPDQKKKKKLQDVAKRHEKHARLAIRKFNGRFGWNEDDAKRAVPFFDAGDSQYFATAVDSIWGL
jgi:tetratricopeptide (TPR) repeat protein